MTKDSKDIDAKYKATITVKNDSVQMVGNSSAYYSHNDDAIYVRKGDMKWSDFGFKHASEATPEQEAANLEITLIHERQHQINKKKGVHDAAMNLDENYQRQTHDEITALIAEKLEIRRQYKACKTEEDKAAFFEKFATNEANADYIRAIRSGLIDPNSSSSEDFKKEMTFIKNSSIAYRADPNDDAYKKQWTQNSLIYLATRGEEVKSNPKALEQSVAKMYENIGGVNFNEYGNKNIHVIENQSIKAADNMLEQGAKPEKVIRFMQQGEGDFKLAETLDVTGLNKEQAEKVLQTAIITQNLSEYIAEDLASGREPDYDYNFVARDCREKTAIYLDLKSDIWEKNGTLTEAGDEEKFNELMKKAKEVQLSPEKTVNFDDVVVKNGKYKLPLDGTSKEDVIAQMDAKDAEDAKFWKEYYEKHPPEKPRISESYEVDIMDLNSDVLKDELAAREEAERKAEEERKRKEEEERKRQEEEQQRQNPDLAANNTQQDTPRSETPAQNNDIVIKPAPYADIEMTAPVAVYVDDGKHIVEQIPKYENAEIKTVIDEKGQKNTVTLLDGQKHGSEITFDDKGQPQIKLFDHGKEINPEGLNIEIKSETKDGYTHNYTLVNGHVFGTELMTDDKGNMQVAFYDADGRRIQENINSKITATEDNLLAEASSKEQLKEDLLAQRGELPLNPKAQSQELRFEWRIKEKAEGVRGMQEKEQQPVGPLRPKEEKTTIPTLWQKDRTD